MIIAKFNGLDGSRGFRKGRIYKLKSTIESGWLFIYDSDSHNSCPYSSMETFLENWTEVRYIQSLDRGVQHEDCSK